MYYTKVMLLVLIFLILSSGSEAQENKYLGYPKPSSKPEIFAPDFVSTQHAEFAGTFSPDFGEYYFTRRGPFPNGIAQIMKTKKTDEGWSIPAVAEFSTNNYEFEPFITPDGERLYFGSRRSTDGIKPGGTMHQWYLDKIDSTWSAPKLLGSPFFDLMVMYPSVSTNKRFYFTSLDGIYFSDFLDGAYKEPIKIGSEINFLPLTAHSFVAPDESYLIFDGQPRGEGKTDIYISYKNDDGSWTKGKSMGYGINSGESQAIASVSPDGECLFFTRDSDIYWVDASIIEKLRLIPALTIAPDSGIIPLTVKFNPDLSTVPDSITSFAWDFDNDGHVDSRLQNPEHTYSEMGKFSVKLNVYTYKDSANYIFVDAINVLEGTTGFGLNKVPIEFKLHQNFPNPFNPSTLIKYQIPSDNFVQIKIYDILGSEIAILINQRQSAGIYEIEFNSNNLSSGMYFYKLSVGKLTETKKMVLIR